MRPQPRALCKAAGALHQPRHQILLRPPGKRGQRGEDRGLPASQVQEAHRRLEQVIWFSHFAQLREPGLEAITPYLIFVRHPPSSCVFPCDLHKQPLKLQKVAWYPELSATCSFPLFTVWSPSHSPMSLPHGGSGSGHSVPTTMLCSLAQWGSWSFSFAALGATNPHPDDDRSVDGVGRDSRQVGRGEERQGQLWGQGRSPDLAPETKWTLVPLMTGR